MSSENSGITAVKAVSMVIMFSMIMVLGNLPLRWKKFKTSTGLISLASGFSGGLFLAIGVLHLLPEAAESIEAYYESKGTQDEEHFPWPNFITVVCFAFVLYIEKVAFVTCMGGDHDSHGHNHGGAEGHVHLPIGMKHNIPQEIINKGVPSPTNAQTLCIAHRNEDEETVLQKDEQIKALQALQAVQPIESDMKPLEIVIPPLELESAKVEVHRTSDSYKVDSHGHDQQFSKMTPYILQIAIGIHAIFEGLAIGIETEFSSCLGIAIAVVCHKWAEGLTLGLAFFRANVDLKMATIMITIQAVMNPIGIMIGWLLSNQGDLVQGIFESVSAGTFLYIAAVEVIVNEFNMKRFRHIKFVLFMLALGFVTSLYFIEQATGA